MAEQIRLADLLQSIGSELVQANERAKQREKAIMLFKECELEFAVDLEKGGSGGFTIWVIKLEGGVKKTEHNTIRLKFDANPAEPMLGITQ
jgi:hypothetical protein